MSKNIFFRLDWLSILIFILLVSFGIASIYSTTFSEIHVSIFNWGTPAGKQFFIFIFCLLMLPLILLVNSNIFEHLSNVFYALSLLSLLGLFIFGQKINGALSWYLIGGFSFQPSEFAKITTAILVSKSLSSIQIDLNKMSINLGDKNKKINSSEKTDLTEMLSNPGKTFSREEIGKISGINQERSIDVMITRLRQKIENNPKNPKYLQTIRGSGYVLWIE